MVFLNYMMFIILIPPHSVYLLWCLIVYDFVCFFLKNNHSKPEGEDDLQWRVGPEPLDFNIKFKYYLNESLFAQIIPRLFLLPVSKDLTKRSGIF